ncbi:MAG TPA: thiamine-phosphate kinase [Firmicutes bacterium]|nr:thiamine-phosphate kinase [Bacillota bacterium]
MNRNDFSEEDFLRWLRSRFKWKGSGTEQGLGIGDDGAVLKLGDKSIIITTDMMTEDVHFKMKYFSIRDLAYKITAVNISDIAAMGGRPKYSLISIGVPGKGGGVFLKRFYDELEKVHDLFKIEMLGGDTVSSRKIVVNMTLFGELIYLKPVLRSGAEPGDLICVTGFPGLAGLGLMVLPEGERKNYPDSVQRHLQPEPRLGFIEGSVKFSKFITSMIDISDGLILDLFRILHQSQRSALLFKDNIPVHSELKSYFKSEKRVLNNIFYSGEDFELLFTLKPEGRNLLEKDFDFNVTEIGVVTDEPGDNIYLKAGNRRRKITVKGYDHLK